MRAYLALLALLAVTSGCFAGDIRPGAAMQVKPNSLWFGQAAQLTHWQQLKKSGDTAALAAYQDKLLHARDAWQFTDQLAVKILGYDARHSKVHVQMTTQGRFAGTDWFLDTNALQ